MNDVAALLKERIRNSGKITLAEFMETALYAPGRGYYTSARQRVGAQGDFFTSPATHPIFAALVAVQLEQLWRILDCPADFTVVEMGAGKGLLADDILSYSARTEPEFSAAVTYIAEERDSVDLVQRGRHMPAEPLFREAMLDVTGCFLSNELLDSFPANRVAVRDGSLQEVYVDLADGEFVEVAGPPSSPLFLEILAEEGIVLPEGYQTEINLNVAPWMSRVADRLKRGLVLTIDYGHTARDLYAPERRRGTLMTYYRHMCGEDPFVRVGTQDMTTHVDFTSAVMAGERNGLHFEALCSQREFLQNLGIDAFIDALGRKGLSNAEYLANRFSMLELIREEGLGSFKVLVQSKGIPDAALICLDPQNSYRKGLKASEHELEIPLLRRDHMPLLRGRYPSYYELETGVPESLWDRGGWSADRQVQEEGRDMAN
ncbi:MAG: SAM-dependent methyltransferase [Dehalococcoidia bacterium]|nr:SAM-dependent methyltransferase [Dehalococcoidia bacterium]